MMIIVARETMTRTGEHNSTEAGSVRGSGLNGMENH